MPDAPTPGPLRARYDDAAQGAPTEAEVDWYASRLPRDAGLVLDAACGSGRLLVPLLARGCAIHGADGSAEALGLAQARLAQAGLATTLYRQDLGSLNLPTRFAAAIVDGDALARIVDRAAARAALERLRGHLVSPGLLLVDARVPDYAGSRPAAPVVELTSVALADGSRILARSEISIDADAKLARGDARYTHRRGTRLVGEEHARFARLWYDADELAALVASAGWRDVAVEASPRALPAGPGADFALVARA